MGYIMHADEDWPKHFASHEQMPEIPSAESALAGLAGAVGFDRAGVISVGCISQFQAATPGERGRIPSVSGWENTIEHIDSGPDSGENIPLVSDSHEIAGFFDG